MPVFCKTAGSRARLLWYYLFLCSFVRLASVPFALAFDIVFLNLFSQQVYALNVVFSTLQLVDHTQRYRRVLLHWIVQALYPLVAGLNLVGTLLLAYIAYRNEGILNPAAVRGQEFSLSLLLLSVFGFHILPPMNDVALTFLFGHALVRRFRSSPRAYTYYFLFAPAVYIAAYALAFDVGYIYGFELRAVDYAYLAPAVVAFSLCSGLVYKLIADASRYHPRIGTLRDLMRTVEKQHRKHARE